MTVVFVDLADSTKISQQLDPETWRDIIARYQHLAAAAVTRFEGRVAQYLGDGLIVYFGFPEAHDDDAERAVRSGLLIVDEIRGLNEALEAEGLPQLGVRVGIHTGAAIVSEGAANEASIYGDTPNIAARVQAEAVRNSVFVTSAVHRLVSGMFLVEDCGKRALKGITEPLQLFHVMRPSGMRSRLDAAAAAHALTPFVGRQDEFQILHSRWTKARNGEGQVIFIVGEAGIGKSRLVHEFRDQIAGMPHTWIECAGSPLFQNAPLHPVSELLQQALALRPDAASEERLRELENRLRAVGLDLGEAIPLISPLMNLPTPESYPKSLGTPEEQHRRLLGILVKWLCASAQIQPLVLVVEDLQWVDPSTLLLQELLAEQGATAPMILLFTSRPDFRLQWPSRAHHAQLVLNRLSPGQVIELIGGKAAGSVIGRDVVDAVVKRAGGVPLFAEELAQLVLDSDHKTIAHEIPATLHDSLMARLDHLGSARELVKVGAAIGSEFSYELLRAVTRMSQPEMQSALKRATDAELLYVRGIAPDSSYMFKHALVRDVAYGTLLKSKRRELHHAIAHALTARSPEASSQPELIAHHLTEAGEFDSAITEWSRAGGRAVARGALKEAENHFSRALELLDKLGDVPELARRKLNVNLSLAQVMQSTHGFATPAIDPIYARARSLATQFGRPAELVYTLVGIWSANLSRRELRAAQEIAEQALAAAECEGESNLLVWGHYAVGTTCYQRGNLALAYDHLKRARALYKQDEYQSTPYDPGVSTLAYLSRTAWHLGLPDTARVDAADSLRLAERHNKPASKALALSVLAGLHISLCEPQRAEEFAAQLADLAASQRMPFFQADAEILRGAAIADQGRLQEGIELMRGGLAQQAAERHLAGLSYYTCFLSRALLAQDRFDEAATAIEQALAALPEQELDHVHLIRLRGEILVRSAELLGKSGNECPEAAERDFEEALRIARGMGAKVEELLAATSLARLLASRGKLEDAYHLLAPMCSSFEEGLDAKVLQTAKSFLSTIET